MKEQTITSPLIPFLSRTGKTMAGQDVGADERGEESAGEFSAGT